MATLPFMLAMLASAPAGASDVLDDEIPVTHVLNTPIQRIQYEDYDFENDEAVVVEIEYQVVNGVAQWRVPGAAWTADTHAVTNVLEDVYALKWEHFKVMAVQATELATDPDTEQPGTWFDLANAYEVALGD